MEVVGTHLGLIKILTKRGLVRQQFPKSVLFFFKESLIFKVIYFKEIKTLYQDVHRRDL